jgi:hypothetical protein
MRTKRVLGLFSASLLVSSAVMAATYPELAERASRRPVVAGYDGGNGAGAPPSGGVATGYPAYGNTAMYMLPAGSSGLPDPRQVRWSYGQVNAASDPFYVWGLRTQGMYVPWSTPMSGWTNAQSWNWWRTRAGDSGPPPPLW